MIFCHVVRRAEGMQLVDRDRLGQVADQRRYIDQRERVACGKISIDHRIRVLKDPIDDIGVDRQARDLTTVGQLNEHPLAVAVFQLLDRGVGHISLRRSFGGGQVVRPAIRSGGDRFGWPAAPRLSVPRDRARPVPPRSAVRRDAALAWGRSR